MFAGSRSSTEGRSRPYELTRRHSRRGIRTSGGASATSSSWATRATGARFQRPSGRMLRSTQPSDRSSSTSAVGAALSSSNVARADGRTRRRRRSSSVADSSVMPSGRIGAPRRSPSAASGHQAGLRSPPTGTTAGVYWAARTGARQSEKCGRSARSSGPAAASTCVASLGHVSVLDVRDDDDRSALECRAHALRVRQGGEHVAAEHEERLEVARLHLVEHRDRRIFAPLARQLRAARRPGLWPRVRGARTLVEPLDEAWVEPHPARPLEGARDGEKRDREPLSEIGGRGHRRAGSRLQCEPAMSPHRGEEVDELIRREAGNGGRGLASKGSTAVRSSSTRVA